MLVVTVEIWPYGDPEHPRRIARIGAAQTSVVAGNVADYEAVVIVDDELLGVAGIRRHRRADGPLELVRRIIDEYVAGPDGIDPAVLEALLDRMGDR